MLHAGSWSFNPEINVDLGNLDDDVLKQLERIGKLSAKLDLCPDSCPVLIQT